MDTQSSQTPQRLQDQHESDVAPASDSRLDASASSVSPAKTPSILALQQLNLSLQRGDGDASAAEDIFREAGELFITAAETLVSGRAAERDAAVSREKAKDLIIENLTAELDRARAYHQALDARCSTLATDLQAVNVTIDSLRSDITSKDAIIARMHQLRQGDAAALGAIAAERNEQAREAESAKRQLADSHLANERLEEELRRQREFSDSIMRKALEFQATDKQQTGSNSG